jgi:hypothetical protein
MMSDDPDFEQKAADVIGLYVKPPQHAVVFCVDEKTSVQALDRLDPVLPLAPGRGSPRFIYSSLLFGKNLQINFCLKTLLRRSTPGQRLRRLRSTIRRRSQSKANSTYRATVYREENRKDYDCYSLWCEAPVACSEVPAQQTGLPSHQQRSAYGF